MLEVRNDGWTPQRIEQYLDFLKFLIDEKFAHVNGDPDRFFQNNSKYQGDYDPIDIHYSYGAQERIGCSIQRCVQIRLQDLAITPCHRLTQDENIAGWFTLDETETKITGVVAGNYALYLQVRNIRGNHMFKCNRCPIQDFCLKGCLGSQYEVNDDHFMPIPSVCNFFKAKFRFLYEYYSTLGILPSITRSYGQDATNRLHKAYALLMEQYKQAPTVSVDDTEVAYRDC
jgi:radical SAM protein with 4Fe4S-binding SPASM domain